MVASKSKAVRWKTEGTKALVWFHRWLGIATCIIFAMWFASGAILLFQPFPSLGEAEQFSEAAEIRLDEVRISPGAAAAAARVGAALERVRLIQRSGHPAYLVETGQTIVAVDARDGRLLPNLAAVDAKNVASAFLNQPAVEIRGPIEYDQWIVDNGFDAARPFFRADAGDDDGTQIYISARTGEVLQRTHASERRWNSVGAVLHWVYFTPLRASFSAWDKVVWSLSLLASLVAMAGITLGMIRTLAVRRARRKGLTFFRARWLKYHHLFGLFVGIFVIGWMTSGWLSMDHGRLFSDGQPSASQTRAYQGQPLAEAVAHVDLKALAGLPAAKSIEITVIGGQALLLSIDGLGRVSAFDAHGLPVTRPALSDRIRQALANTWPGIAVEDAGPVPSDDFYAVAESMPDSVHRFTLDDAGSVYVDAASTAIITMRDRSRTAYAWLYYGLHTFKFPGLIDRPVLRNILVMIPLSLGFLFSITGVIIGYQRLRKSA